MASFFTVYSSFNCISIFGLPNSMLYHDHSIQCWDEDHKKWFFGFTLPLLVFWIILAPIFLFLKVYRNIDLVRKRDEKFMNTYGIITKALNDNCFYWEFFIYFNKHTGAIVSIFLARMTEGLMGLFLVFAWTMSLLEHKKFSPYLSDFFIGYFI